MPDQAHRESGEQGQCTDVTRGGERERASHAMQDIGGTTLTAGLFPPRLLEIVRHCSTSVRALPACPLHFKPLSSSRQL